MFLDIFVRDFILAKENVQTLIKKDYYNKNEKIWVNVDSVDEYIKFNYNEKNITGFTK